MKYFLLFASLIGISSLASAEDPVINTLLSSTTQNSWTSECVIQQRALNLGIDLSKNFSISLVKIPDGGKIYRIHIDVCSQGLCWDYGLHDESFTQNEIQKDLISLRARSVIKGLVGEKDAAIRIKLYERTSWYKRNILLATQWVSLSDFAKQPVIVPLAKDSSILIQAEFK